MKNPLQTRIGQRFVNHWRSQWKSHLGTLALVVAVMVAVQVWHTRNVPDGPAPDFTTALASGGAVTLQQWRAAHPGQAVALHFWADWCSICRTEEHSVSRISRDWPVLSVAMQSGDAARVQGVLTRRELAWHTAIDTDGRIAKSYGMASVPALVVLDAQGQIRFAEVGYTSEIGMRLRLWWAQTF